MSLQPARPTGARRLASNRHSLPIASGRTEDAFRLLGHATIRRHLEEFRRELMTRLAKTSVGSIGRWVGWGAPSDLSAKKPQRLIGPFHGRPGALEQRRPSSQATIRLTKRRRRALTMARRSSDRVPVGSRSRRRLRGVPWRNDRHGHGAPQKLQECRAAGDGFVRARCSRAGSHCSPRFLDERPDCSKDGFSFEEQTPEHCPGACATVRLLLGADTRRAGGYCAAGHRSGATTRPARGRLASGLAGFGTFVISTSRDSSSAAARLPPWFPNFNKERRSWRNPLRVCHGG